jgi:3-hydroxybutyryl-CoA dehydrogenase
MHPAGPLMPELPVQNISIIGAGTMGSGIAALSLLHGFQVALFDPDPAALARAQTRITRRADAAAHNRLTLHSSLEAAVGQAQFVIEAVPEQLELKRGIFAQLDRLAPPDAVLASNTSERSITVLAGATLRPEQVIGMHWFNPPERMQLIEIVKGVHTSAETLQLTRLIAERCGKTTVTVNDHQGFVTTRALAALLVESVRMLEEGVATAEDIDKAVKLGLNHPMGPLELADYIGLDTVLFISEGMKDALGERFLAPQTLRRLVDAGLLGRKSGRGFYDYAT